jgi:hypothetical protein
MRLLIVFGLFLLSSFSFSQDTVPSFFVERYFSPDQLHLFCLPVSHTSVRNFKGLQLKYYNEPLHSWFNISTQQDSTLSLPMVGYGVSSSSIIPDSNTILFTGIINTGQFSIFLHRTLFLNTNPQRFDGWNLVGNPYPSATDWESSSWNLSNVDPTVYLFDGNNYRPYNRNNQLGNGFRYISSMQGFFLHVTSGISGIVEVDNSSRVHDYHPYLKGNAVLPDLLILQVAGNNYSDEATIHFDSSSTPFFDWESDAFKLFGVSGSPQIFTILPDTALSIDVRPFSGQNTIVQLGFKAGVEANYSIVAHNTTSFQINDSIYLEDKLLNKWHNLSADSIYSFYSSPFDDVSRFLLHFDYTITDVCYKSKNSHVLIYSRCKTIYIKFQDCCITTGTIFVFDLSGRKVFQGDLKDRDLNYFKLNLNKGYYLVKLLTNEFILNEILFIE